MKTICIAGKNDIAVSVLLHCMRTYPEHRIIVVCTKGDNGVNGWQKSLLWFARKNKIEVVQIESVYKISDLVFLSVEFDRIIRPDLFLSDKLYNIHFSLLPEYKGCYPSVLPILHGKNKTGVTFHKIDSGIDTGAIIDQIEIMIDCKDTSYDLYKKLTQSGTELIKKNLPTVINGKEKSRAQSAVNSTYHSKKTIDYRNLELDINTTAYQIQNQIRAFGFRPYQIIKWRGTGYVECEVTNVRSCQMPGTIIEENEIYSLVTSVDYNVKLYKDVLEKVISAVSNKKVNYAIGLCKSVQIIDAQEEHGISPLTAAVMNGNKDMIDFLIEKGADINVKDWEGKNLLVYAVGYGFKTNDWSVFIYLKELGLDCFDQDYDGISTSDLIIQFDRENTGIIPEYVRKSCSFEG